MMNYSYHPSPKKAKEKKSYAKFFLWMFFLMISAGGASGYLLFSPKWQVSNIEVSGCRAIKQQNVIQKLEQLFTEKELFVFPKSSLVLLSKTKVSNFLLEQFPRIKNIEIDKEIADTIQIEIEEKKPVAVWCGSTEIEIIEATTTDEIIISEQAVKEKSAAAGSYGETKEEKKKYIYELDKNNCFYIDEQGEAFENISDVELGLLDKNIIKVQQWKTEKIEIRKDKMEITFFDFAKAVKTELQENLNINIDKFVIPNPLAKELYAIMPEGWKIYFNTEDDALAQVEVLKVVLDKKIPASERASLDYIDLRVGEKVFYKFR